VIATGTSDPHLKALRDNLEKTLKDNKIELYSRNRFQSSGWLVGWVSRSMHRWSR